MRAVGVRDLLIGFRGMEPGEGQAEGADAPAARGRSSRMASVRGTILRWGGGGDSPAMIPASGRADKDGMASAHGLSAAADAGGGLPFRLTRRFAVVCGAALVVSAALLSLLYAVFATRELVQTAERNNVAVTTLFQASIMRSSPQLAGDLVEDLSSGAQVDAMREEVVAHMRGTEVVKVKIYDRQGRTVFSTETRQIGEEKLDDEGVVSALAGAVASELTYRDTYSSFENRVEHADLLSSYIPIRSAGGLVEGVFEVYTDVSAIVALIARTQILLTAAVVLVFALVYGTLVWAVGHSDRIIRRQHEQAVALAFGALGRMTGALAHDLNNLLGIVMGNLDLLAHRLPASDRESASRIEYAQDAAARATQLMRSLLAVARRQPQAVGPCNVNQLVSEMVPLIRASIGGAADLRCELSQGALVVRMDANNFGNVVLNLVINARDAMKDRRDGEIVLRTRWRRLEAGAAVRLVEGDYAVIEVADTGAGMSPEVASRAFEPFFTTKGDEKGTGLGLAMVRRYAEELKGAAEIDSRKGGGTTVRLYLPLMPQAAAPGREQSRPGAPSRE
jgi:signal transduction histidine kinase